jgi:tRNA (guanine37-N1)-methyltransferase
MFRIDVLTLFPMMIEGYVSQSIIGKARAKQLIDIRSVDVRTFAEGRHRVTDDTPYGGGAGMVMKVEPLVGAIEASKKELPKARVLLMDPRGKQLTQEMAKSWAKTPDGLVLVCGRYEGVDERVSASVDDMISLGDFVLTGGELAALAVIDSVSRLRPGVLGNEESSTHESFESGLLEYPQYTRPPEFRGQGVPAVLQSGDHARIARWRRWQSLKLTQKKRPDLFEKLSLTEADQKLMATPEDQL